MRAGGVIVMLAMACGGSGAAPDAGGDASAADAQAAADAQPPDAEPPDAGPPDACVPAEPLCQDADLDCNGIADHLQPPCECVDGAERACGSQVGVCSFGSQPCVAGVWGSCDPGAGPATLSANEAAVSLCNGLDDNCDGSDDEGCACAPPEERLCGIVTGDCAPGTEACQANGTWGDCTGETNPAARQCDDHDRDCDGTTDYLQAPCACRNGDTRTCSSNVGVCRFGSQTCVAGAWNTCSGQTLPTTMNANEAAVGLCNGLDDNCEGRIDEGCGCTSGASRSCGSDVGLCSLGTQTCSPGGAWGFCVGDTEPAARVCDGDDHDCDGTDDYLQAPCQCQNGATRACGIDTGVCASGLETCTSGTWGGCTATGPTTTSPNEALVDLCNGDDDNCSGADDEGCGCVPPATQACGSDVGDCVAGTQACNADGTWATCSGTGPSAPACDDHDRDCNGIADHQQPPCACLNGSVRYCGTDEGACEYGTETCAAGQWGECTGGGCPL
jgi:hypothetical protein